jgi:hypothetical protein
MIKSMIFFRSRWGNQVRLYWPVAVVAFVNPPRLANVVAWELFDTGVETLRLADEAVRLLGVNQRGRSTDALTDAVEPCVFELIEKAEGAEAGLDGDVAGAAAATAVAFGISGGWRSSASARAR